MISKEKEAARLTYRADSLWRNIVSSDCPYKYIPLLSGIDEAREREGIEPETGMTEVQIFNALYR